MFSVLEGQDQGFTEHSPHFCVLSNISIDLILSLTSLAWMGTLRCRKLRIYPRSHTWEEIKLRNPQPTVLATVSCTWICSSLKGDLLPYNLSNKVDMSTLIGSYRKIHISLGIGHVGSLSGGPATC